MSTDGTSIETRISELNFAAIAAVGVGTWISLFGPFWLFLATNAVALLAAQFLVFQHVQKRRFS